MVRKHAFLLRPNDQRLMLLAEIRLADRPELPRLPVLTSTPDHRAIDLVELGRRRRSKRRGAGCTCDGPASMTPSSLGAKRWRCLRTNRR